VDKRRARNRRVYLPVLTLNSDYLVIYELKKNSKYFPFPLAAVEVHRFARASLEPLFLPTHRNLNDMWDFDLVTRMWSMIIENLTKMGLSPV